MTDAPGNEGVIEAFRQLLRSFDVPESELEDAATQGPQAMVALFADRVFVPGEERITRSEVVERAGVTDEEASAFWRALGFADVPEGEPVFTEVDAEMMRRVGDLVHSQLTPPEMALQLTRVMGRAAAQIAAALIDTVRRGLDLDATAPPPALLSITPNLIQDLEGWLVYIFRRHFAAEAKRTALMATSLEAGTAIVGFADLVGFTGLSQELDEETLARAVTQFETTTGELVSLHGGRVVKMIGDEVMFEANSAKEGAEIALYLVDAFSTDEDDLPEVRVGLAAGPALRNQGDIFGTAPNLASRLVDQAYPATVLVSEAVHEALEEDEDYQFKSVRGRNLKGFGRVPYYVLRRTGDETREPRFKIAPILKEITDVLTPDER